MDISRDELVALLHFDPPTGEFTRIKVMPRGRPCRIGTQCGSVNKVTGYVEIHAGGAKHYGHRLAWIYCHGAIPDGMRVDHANRTRSDNRLSNLRLATHSDNLRNCKVRVDNSSGVKGVHFDGERGKWCAEVAGHKLGRFDTLLDAAAARRSAALRRFGAFANE